ncbi:MAG: hypothetical protein HY282_04435 [Nitrospirae bacterium]|nr:hypothetical protein [Candidatus Manganitrophaceae bacterium]
MSLRMTPKRNPLLFALLFVLWVIAKDQKSEAREAKFKMEVLQREGGPVVSKIWTVANTLIITEPLSLPGKCQKVAGEVNIQGRKIFVKVKASEKEPAKEGDCAEGANPTGVKITIPALQTGDFSVNLETPQRELTDTIKVDW